MKGEKKERLQTENTVGTVSAAFAFKFKLPYFNFPGSHSHVILKFYFENFCYCKFKARFLNRVIFAFEKRYDKDLSN